MNEPWFDPAWSWLPGTLLGVVGGIWGTACGILMPLSRKKGRWIGMKTLRSVYVGLILYSGLCLLAGLIALVHKQPYGVWYGLLMAGVIGVFALGFQYPLLAKLPRQIEKDWGKNS